jgi:uncharacterized protein YgiM (DUF1202 family)
VPVKYTVTSVTRVREKPTTDSAIIAILKPGQEVEGTETNQDWVKVELEGKIGWVSIKLLKEIK